MGSAVRELLQQISEAEFVAGTATDENKWLCNFLVLPYCMNGAARGYSLNAEAFVLGQNTCNVTAYLKI